MTVQSKGKLADKIIDWVYNCKCRCHTGDFGCNMGSCLCYSYLEPMLRECGIPIKHEVLITE